MKLTKKKREEIQKYLKDNPIKINWEYKDCLSDKQILKIISSENGLWDLEAELYEMNLDFFFDMEDTLYKNVIEEFELDMEIENFRDEFLDYVSPDVNIENFLNNTPDITILAKVHSNYDCATSTQQIEEKGGLFRLSI